MKTRYASPRNALLALILLAGAALTLPASAQPGTEPPPPGAPTQLAGHRMGGDRGPGRDAMRQHMRGQRFMQRHGGQPGGIESRMLLRPEVRQRLNLTDQQAQQIQQLDYNTQKQLIDLEAQVKKAELDLGQLMQQPRPDRQQVLNQVDAVSQARAAKTRAEIAHNLDLRQILTDEQIATIRQHLESGPGGPGFDREAMRERMQRMRQQWQQQQQQPGQGGQGGQGTGAGPFGQQRGPRGGGGPFGQGGGQGGPGQFGQPAPQQQ